MTRPFEQRRAQRKLIVLGGTVVQGETRHPCLIRDVSETGLFLYVQFVPAIGETLKVDFSGVVCHGCVVRVETKDSGAATGVGLRLTRLQPAGAVEAPCNTDAPLRGF